MRHRLYNPQHATYVAPMSNTALRTIRLRCAGDPMATSYAAVLVALPAATRARPFSILGGPVNTLGSCRFRLNACNCSLLIATAAQAEPKMGPSLRRNLGFLGATLTSKRASKAWAWAMTTPCGVKRWGILGSHNGPCPAYALTILVS
jgi:hypothetical protein